MILVNETQQKVSYYISAVSSGQSASGTIEVNGVADLPAFDNQTNVGIQFSPADETAGFQMKIDDTHSGEQLEMAIVIA